MPQSHHLQPPALSPGLCALSPAGSDEAEPGRWTRGLQQHGRQLCHWANTLWASDVSNLSPGSKKKLVSWKECHLGGWMAIQPNSKYGESLSSYSCLVFKPHILHIYIYICIYTHIVIVYKQTTCFIDYPFLFPMGPPNRGEPIYIYIYTHNVYIYIHT